MRLKLFREKRLERVDSKGRRQYLASGMFKIKILEAM